MWARNMTVLALLVSLCLAGCDRGNEKAEAVDEAVRAPGPAEPAKPEFELPIKQYSAEEFSRFRMKSPDAELVTSLELSLKTKDGDRVRVNSFNEETDRIVNMNVTGDLSDAEKAAVDAVLERVIEVANKFFDGSLSCR